jgi:ubiquinone/menaquinone biosynthesis C-methylase UbiE
MEWVVLDWNQLAIEFYDGLGARHMREWYTYRLTAEQLADIAGASSPPPAPSIHDAPPHAPAVSASGGNRRYMRQGVLQAELGAVADRWSQVILERNPALFAQLSVDSYTATYPNGVVLNREQELATMASSAPGVAGVGIRTVELDEGGGAATVVFEWRGQGTGEGEPGRTTRISVVTFLKTGGEWRATSSRIIDEHEPSSLAQRDPGGGPARAGVSSRLVRRVGSWVKRRIRGAPAHTPSDPAPTFPELAYLPYRPRTNYALPPGPEVQPAADASGLPVPPRNLWLGYHDYLARGREHVETMLGIVHASGFSWKDGDRILDVGCASGRMIRHLHGLAGRCEIWGTDISAEHIFWCKRHLSPPFHFATTTKVPHLPFEDRSFRLIYCGSLFTHIDDLADAWLLELKRILAPDGRLYLTAHDNHTIDLYETGEHATRPAVRWIRSHEVYQQSKASFGMFTVGRDHESQVYYDREYLSRMLRSNFEILSITEEAYTMQTAYLLRRKAGAGD